MYLPPGHPIMAIRNNRNQNGRRIGKKFYSLITFDTQLKTAVSPENGSNKMHVDFLKRHEVSPCSFPDFNIFRISSKDKKLHLPGLKITLTFTLQL